MSFLSTILFVSLAVTSYAKPVPLLPRQTGGQSLNIKFDIKDGNSYKAWITGLSYGSPVMVTASGQIYTDQPGANLPSSLAIDTSQGVTIPSYLAGARVFITTGDSLGIAKSGAIQEPSASNPSGAAFNQRWGIAEFTTQTGVSFANPSYVDFMGLPVGVSMGGGTAQGATSTAVDDACSFLSTKGDAWSALCVGDGAGKRVLSPTQSQGGGLDKFWDDYIEAVWLKYASTKLTIDTRTWGLVECGVSGESMTCTQDDVPFGKPTSADVWGCHSGTFSTAVGGDVHKAIIPILCAGFHRGTLLLEGGEKQPAPQSMHYTDEKGGNWYCKAVKDNESDGRGYCFPYDDVHVEGEETAGVVTTQDLSGGLTIIVGGSAGGGDQTTSAAATTSQKQVVSTGPTVTTDATTPPPAPSESATTTETTTTNEVKMRRECTPKFRQRRRRDDVVKA